MKESGVQDMFWIWWRLCKEQSFRYKEGVRWTADNAFLTFHNLSSLFVLSTVLIRICIAVFLWEERTVCKHILSAFVTILRGFLASYVGLMQRNAIVWERDVL